ncbi:MAG: hypothetical protein HQK54_10860 [Oligoflexales bacterium]|nr:hypothetical protein [Oligoflexales bacterium]
MNFHKKRSKRARRNPNIAFVKDDDWVRKPSKPPKSKKYFYEKPFPAPIGEKSPVLTDEMKQAIKILQLSRNELEAFVAEQHKNLEKTDDDCEKSEKPS